MSTHFRVTYAILSADNGQLHEAYEAGLRRAVSWLGSDVYPRVAGQARPGGQAFTLTSPGDRSVTLGRVHSATSADVNDAVGSAATGSCARSQGRWSRE